VPRPDKVAKVDEVSRDFTGAAATLLTHYRGLTVTDLAQLRAKLREANAEMRVVKNTLTKRAAAAAGIDGLDELLVGPTGLVFCAEDPVGPAKALKDFAKDHPSLVIRGGYLDGEILDDVAATKLADLESREELLAKLAGLMYSTLANTARLLNAATEKQARLMQALVDAGGVEARGFSPEGAAPPPAEPDVPAEDAPAAEDAPVAEDDAPADDAPADDAPAAEDDAPVADAPADDAPAAEDDAPVADAGEAATDEAATDEAATDEAATDEA
jgi:large subunit ribosomal protein L10